MRFKLVLKTRSTCSDAISLGISSNQFKSFLERFFCSFVVLSESN